MVAGLPNGLTVPVAYSYKYIDEVLDAAAETAKPSHNHDEGIKGAQTVVLAIFRALQFGREASQHIKEILTECAEFAKYDINIKKENVINKFDETCQGTVPVALWIIGQSTSFEDAVRKAVALGADADTLGPWEPLLEASLKQFGEYPEK